MKPRREGCLFLETGHFDGQVVGAARRKLCFGRSWLQTVLCTRMSTIGYGTVGIIISRSAVAAVIEW